jgi:hypothetical protein
MLPMGIAILPILRRFGEIEASCADALAVDNSYLAGRNCMLAIDHRGHPWFARKAAEEHCSERWTLSRMTCTRTPHLWASWTAFPCLTLVRACLLAARLAMWVIDGFGFRRSALPQKNRQHNHHREGEEFTLPVL